MAKITFFLQSTNNPATIYIRLSEGRKCDLRAKTNLIIDPAEWNHKKQSPRRPGDVDMRNLQTKLENMRSQLISLYNSTDGVKDKEWLNGFLNPEKKGATIPQDLIGYFNFYIEARKNELAESEVRKINVVKNKLIKWGKKHLVKDVGEDFKKSFTDWCVKQNYADNTTGSNLKIIKRICLYASRKGVQAHPELDLVTGSYKKAVSVYLSFEEIKSIQEAKIRPELEDARDWLIISCYTAQRVGDLMRFHSSMIRTQKDVKIIDLNQNKGKKDVVIPLHPIVLDILKKRNGEFPKRMVPEIYNKEIKCVCKAAGLNEEVYGGLMVGKRKVYGQYPKYKLVSSHIGRRSFATNYYGTVPTVYLMSATGHSTEKSFLIYIGKADADRALELAKWF